MAGENNSHLFAVFLLAKIATIYFILSQLLSISSATNTPKKCPSPVPQADIFVDSEHLTETNVFSDFSNARPCENPGNLCSEPNYCQQQLPPSANVSNLIPCCVKLKNGSSVCQCVITMPNSNSTNQCPSSNLTLVSNLLFNASGISQFFKTKIPICSTFHNSWNIYEGLGPALNWTAEPFLPPDSNKVGFHAFLAFNFGAYYVNWYFEFLLICKTNKNFVSTNDLKPCTKEQRCVKSLPFVDILIDTTAVDLTSLLFHPLNGESNCMTMAPIHNQCPARNSGCSKSCCYNANCIFTFNPPDDTCPCPPSGANLVLSIHSNLSCTIMEVSKMTIHIFDKENPPDLQPFVWNLGNDIPPKKPTDLIIASGSVKSPVNASQTSLYWYGEIAFGPDVFEGCLKEITDKIKFSLS